MGEAEERKVNAMSTKEGVMIMNGWDSAESKRVKGWAEKNRKSIPEKFGVRDVGGQRKRMPCGSNQFERGFECRCELAVALVEVVGLETGTLAGIAAVWRSPIE